VAVDVAAARSPGRGGLGLARRIAAAPTAVLLGALVALSTGIRTLIAVGHAVPVYFPDEYIYSALARGFAETGTPVIRGHAAHFPSLLEPIVAAPFWLFGDPMLAYRLTQFENALAMSLGAVPVYLLARRLGCGKNLALAVGAVAVASADLYFSAFVLAGPVAYPLVLSAVYAGVCVLDRPTRWNQLAFVTFSALSAFARIQYVILPVALAAAALVVERGSIRTVVNRLRLTLCIFLVAGLAFAVAGPARALGYYSGVAHEHVRPWALVHWFGVDAMLLAYSCGIVLVPGALVGLALALVRAKSRAERSFAALTVMLAAAVFAEAALYASNGSARYQERYLMALAPLVAMAFALYVRRGLPGRRFVLGFSAGFVVLAATVPLSGYAVGDSKQDSPLLFAVFRVEQLVGSAGSGALLVAVAATVLCGVAAALTVAGRRALPIGLAVTVVAFCAISLGAHAVDRSNAASIRNDFLPVDPQWIDHAGLGRVALVETPAAPFGRALEQMIWNRSVQSVYLLGNIPPVDNFGATQAMVAPDGRLVTHTGAPKDALLVENYGTQVQLRDARRVSAGGSFELWRPQGAPRVDWMTFGRYWDGWLAGRSQVLVWPARDGRVRGTLRLELHSPSTATPLQIHFAGPGVDRTVDLRPGQTREVAIPVNVRGVWRLTATSSMHGTLWDGRSVSVRVGGPTFSRS